MKFGRRFLRWFQPRTEAERCEFRSSMSRALAEAEGLVHECNRLVAKHGDHLKIVVRK